MVILFVEDGFEEVGLLGDEGVDLLVEPFEEFEAVSIALNFFDESAVCDYFLESFQSVNANVSLSSVFGEIFVFWPLLPGRPAESIDHGLKDEH